MRQLVTALVLVLAGLAGVTAAQAACPTDAEAKAVAEAYAGGKQVAPPSGLSPEDAMCGRDKVVRLITPHFGPVVGHKAGLTNAAAQKALNYAFPVRGFLLEKMLKRDGDTVSAGAPGTIFEADLVVEVKDETINQARTPLEALRAIRAVFPFIEVPRVVFSGPLGQLGGPNLIYANVAAFGGVLGKPVTVEPTQAGLDALASMTVTLMDGTGATLDTAPGAALMANPINAAIWIVEDLRKAGGALKTGDLLSLGTFSRLHPAKPGGGARVRYQGLPGNPEVSVRFVE